MQMVSYFTHETILKIKGERELGTKPVQIELFDYKSAYNSAFSP